MRGETTSNILDQFGKPIEKVIDSRALLGIDLPGSFADQWHKQKKPNRDQLLSEYKGIAYCCANLNAAKVTGTALRLYRKTSTTREKRALDWKTKSVDYARSNWLTNGITKARVADGERLEELTNHPLCNLLDRPNKYLTWTDFAFLTEIYQWTIGGAYWYVAKNRLGVPQELYLLYPEYLRTIYDDENNVPLHYEYGKGNDVIVYKLDDVIPLLAFRNPRNHFEPYSPLFSVFEQLNITNKYSATEAAMLDNEGRISGIFSPKDDAGGGIGDDEADRWEQRINSKLRRAGNGSFLVLDGDASFTPITYSPRDLSQLKVKDGARLDVMNAHGVPYQLFASMAGSQYDVQATVLEQWIHQAIIPRIRHNQTALNAYLVPLFDDTGDLILAYDDPSVKNKTQVLEETTKLVTGNIITPNEARAIYGYEPAEWGDEPAGMYSQAKPEDEPAEQPEAKEPEAEAPEVETEGGTAEEPAPEVSAETKQESALLGMVGGIQGALEILQALAAGQIARETAVRMFSLFYHISPDEAEALIGTTGEKSEPKPETAEDEGEMVRPEPFAEKACSCGKCGGVRKDFTGHSKLLPTGDELAKCLKEFFASQREKCLKSLGAGGKAAGDGQLPSKFLHLKQADLELYHKSQPVVELSAHKAYQEEGKDLVARAGISPDVFSVHNPKVAEAARKAAMQFCESTNATTTEELNKALDELRKDIEEGLVEGDRMSNLVERVKGVFTRASDERAGLIAQTESSRAHHEGQKEAAKASGVVKGFKLLPSTGACSLCLSLADDEIPIDGYFMHDEDAPEAYQDKLVPIHPACECAMESVLADMDEGQPEPLPEDKPAEQEQQPATEGE
jgi:HK97 family phage portal protein